ncbi:DEAD/DEAH box helicase family protein [Desulfitobacterium sp.]|uniref:DEAD/DEAH box helicase family protein n=1 Tax=Desulfitobacterium sp. TaxID=49981 RepID=UPI002BE74AF0|nr:DEAD/DEAH box helicase family protein [Desulfitobacterium sp.]HVJ48097.1 DEAD/DEAH box helicase family protein [Desulfitobacterium sp.]
MLQKDEDDTPKPWETVKVHLSKEDYPPDTEIVRGSMLYISKSGFSERALNQIKRLAAFKNPEFYKAQAMRMPTYDKPRVISCSEEIAEYICLPRGCEEVLDKMLKDAEVSINWIDKTNQGRIINVEFNGCLREEQQIAAREMLRHTNGVLSGTTAFGKTVVAINLIAERQTNTLILVDKVSLALQWKERLEEFLIINEVITEGDTKKRKRKDQLSIIGQLGGGKDSLAGIVDIAVMQSLYRQGEVKECVKNYGMVIVDECHHVSAVSFEQVLKQISAKYVYGLTATPIRKDGHHPIIFMQCGPIRYRDDALKQAAKRPFEHYIVPRFTSFRVPLDKLEKEITIQELYSEIVVNEMRNQQIIEDVIKCHENGRNCLVLTERTAHVEWIAKELSKTFPDVISLTGGMGAKAAKEMRERIANQVDNPLILVATGKYIGEGFDEPRLDTLFLAMPISWKGTLQQYAGRLHRLCEGKSEVQIYDYVDFNVRMLDKMYHKRLSGYVSIGYKAKGETLGPDAIDIIFNKQSFMPVYSNDLISAEREIIIVSPFITKKGVLHMMEYLRAALEKKVKVVVVTRPKEDFKGKNPAGLVEALELLKEEKISLVLRSNIHQKFAVMDQKLVWYGSINLLSFGSSEESIMRLESPNVAHELIKSI